MNVRQFALFIFLMATISISYAGDVAICHFGKTLNVGQPAVPAHQAHGDTLGACSEAPLIFDFPSRLNGQPVSVNDIQDPAVSDLDQGTPDFEFNKGVAKTVMVPIVGSSFKFNVRPVNGYTLNLRTLYKTGGLSGIPANSTFDPCSGDFTWKPKPNEMGNEYLVDIEQLNKKGEVANAVAMRLIPYIPSNPRRRTIVVSYDPTDPNVVTTVGSPVGSGTSNVTTAPSVNPLNRTELSAAAGTPVTSDTPIVVAPNNVSGLVVLQLQISGIPVVGTPVPASAVTCAQVTCVPQAVTDSKLDMGASSTPAGACNGIKTFYGALFGGC